LHANHFTIRTWQGCDNLKAALWICGCPIFGHGGLTRWFALHSCRSWVASCTDSWPFSRVSLCDLAARKISRSSCYVTRSQCCACGCLIKNVGGRCGVSVAFERSGWLALWVPVAPFGGWLFLELPPGRIFLLWRGSKEARAHRPESGVPATPPNHQRRVSGTLRHLRLPTSQCRSGTRRRH